MFVSGGVCMKFRVSCVQMEPKLGDKAYNLDRMKQYIHSVMSQYPDTRLIVFPELCTTGYEGTPELFQELAETITEGESIRRIGALAKQYHTHIVYGFAERDTTLSDVLYNSAVMIDEDGKVLGSYHKVHPFADEKRWCRAGSSLPLFDTALGRIGIQICWDTAFPEISRCYAVNGADLLVVSTNWENPYEIPGWTRGTLPNPHAEDWDLITAARAFDNTLHLVAANRIGDDGGALSFFGRSKIMDPRGKTIASLDEEVEGIISAEIDTALTQQTRSEYYTFFKDRQPAVYADIIKAY